MTIHKAGYKLLVKIAVALLIANALVFYFLGNSLIFHVVWIASAIIYLLIVNFFRSPNRIVLLNDNHILAPADGKIVIVDRRFENEYLKRECIQVSIFMSIFNVHVNYYPVGGVVKYYKYHPGNYIIANHPKASEKNERTSIAVETSSGTTLLFRQIAGYIARRIVCYAKEEKRANQCDQVGFIKFGSRVDIFLPVDSQIMVKTGDCVSACQTVIAKLPK